MQVQDLKTFVVGNPPPHYGGRYFVLVKITTDSGVSGVGEAYCLPFRPKVVVKMIEDVFERCLQGRDPHHIEALWRRVYSSGFTQNPDLSLMGVLSALEMACWDIIGKEAGQPVYNLLGGKVHEKLRSYTYIYAKPGDKTNVYADPVLAAERALEYVAMGFTALKFDPAGAYSDYDGRQLSLKAMARCVRFCRLIREAVGDEADLLFGTHGQMTAAGAIRLARQLEPFAPLWFEEPVPPDSPTEMAKVARATAIPIATGERLATKYAFAQLLRAGSAAIFQMNLGRVGGILEAKKIASMAETQHVQIAPHLYCGPIVGVANIHLSTCSPNFLILESIETWQGFQAEMLHGEIRWENGYVIPPTEPGLGVTLNEALLEKHPYDGDLLHLDMAAEVIYER